MKISGSITFPKRAIVKAPDDGVHKPAANGGINCTHAALFDGKTYLPYGSTLFYWPMGDTGLKIYLSLSRLECAGHKTVFDQALLMRHNKRLCPKVHRIFTVQLDLALPDGAYTNRAWAMEVQSIQPNASFVKYQLGYPYEFSMKDDDSPSGYHRFVNRCERQIGDQEYKLGNVLFDTVTKRWYLVDVRS